MGDAAWKAMVAGEVEVKGNGVNPTESLATAIKVHQGVDSLQKLRGEWESLQRHPNSDFEHFLLVCGLRGAVIEPWAVSVWNDGGCTAVVAGRLEYAVLRPRVGYGRLPGLRLKVLTILHEGILGVLDELQSCAVVKSMGDVLASGQADVVDFNALQERFSGVWTALRTWRGPRLGTHRPAWAFHRALALESSPGFLVQRMRSKHRSWVKRKERELANAYPSDIRWVWHRAIPDLENVCASMEAIAETTYQRGLGAGFVNDDETRQRLTLFARRGQVRVFLLEISGRPRAFWLGLVYQGVFHASATGYTPDMRVHEVGSLMLLRMVDELVKEGVGLLDFGLGDAEYKERYATLCWREAGVQVFAPTWRGCVLWCYAGAAGFLDRIGRKCVQRLGLFGWVKRLWRRRVRQ